MAYELALSADVRVHNVFHASLLKKYVYDIKHVIDWSLLQVEPEGNFSRNLRSINQRLNFSLIGIVSVA